MDYVVGTLLTGVGATALIDLWALVRQRTLGVPPPDWALVGRWLAHMPRGRLIHDSIKAAAPVRGERAGGWVAHYLIGIAFAALLPAIWGVAWLQHPQLVPALAVGIGTVAAPLLLMQPGMGAGIAARRTPNPAAARMQAVVTHTIFGLGLYAAGWAVSFIYGN